MQSDLFLDPNWTRDQLITKRDTFQNENDQTQDRLTALKDQIETERGRRFSGERIDAQWWADANNQARALGLRIQKLQSTTGEINRRIRRIDAEATRRGDFVILIEATKQHVAPEIFETIWTDFVARKACA